MLEIFEGKMGGGKTYCAVLRVAEWVAAGGEVFTNVPCVASGIARLVALDYGVEMDPAQLVFLDDDKITRFHRYTADGSLIVLDEIHLWYNARDWARTGEYSREVLAFVTQSRKYKNDLILISQSMFNVDKQFARQVQYIWRFRDMERFIVPVLGCKWPLKQIMQIQCDYDGRTVLNRHYVSKRKVVFEAYDTNAVYKSPFERLKRRQFIPKRIIVPEWRRYAPYAVAAGAAAGVLL